MFEKNTSFLGIYGYKQGTPKNRGVLICFSSENRPLAAEGNESSEQPLEF